MHPANAPPPEFDVAVRHDSLRYGGAFLIRDLDFVLPGGRWTCLLGPSGVGKSSLLRVIAGLAPLDGGGVSADEAPVAASHVSRNRAGVASSFETALRASSG